MSIEESLKQRYKIIADYPGNVWGVGTVMPSECSANKTLNDQVVLFYKKYPHLFKPLEWWEERALAEMPEYVKYIATGAVSPLTSEMVGMGGVVLEDYLPATESDYLTYKSISILK